MIQCETCKVWQHCPCVGLGNGEVTPDKYYCDSCRPENHPYRVQDGQLIPSSKRAYHTPSTISAGSKAKASKKRSTAISKDASHLTELSFTEQGSDDHACEVMMASKSAGDNLSNGHNRASKRRKKTESSMDEDGLANDGVAYSPNGPDNEDCEDNYIPDCDPESYTGAANVSLKAMNKNKISRSSKSKKVKTAATHSLPGSPQDFIDDSSEPHDGQAAEPSQTPSPQQQTSRKVSGKKGARLSENDATIATDKMTPSVKRKKVNKPETPQREESLPAADHSDESNQVFAKESSMEPLNTTAPSTSNDSHSTPQSTIKRAGFRRGHTHTACPDTPTPTGTPQPMQPAPPAKVKYPSSRMSLKDMNKRAQQLLEYIGRVQAEMAELKNRSSQKSPASVECDVTSLARSQGLTVDTEMQSLNAGSTDAESKWLSTPPQSVHELSHGDGSEQTTKPLPKQDTDQPDTSGSGEEKDKAPITPPHQPMTASHSGSEPMEEDSGDTQKNCAENPGMIEPATAEVTSLDLIDKLTGDLILFQTRFGRYGD
ncbi:hypothetical protein BGX26_011154 [Mortierella sp. AD094]|nr:hypothetical protein BGX26_011154 [Mortierella sp. AD094]